MPFSIHHAVGCKDTAPSASLEARRKPCRPERGNLREPLAGHYQDRYVRTSGGWRICASTFTVTSTLLTSAADGMWKLMFMGAQANPEIDDPSLQA